MNRVRDLRLKKGIQAKQLALEIGVSNATVSDWEHNRKNPSGERLTKLSEFFGVEESVILGKSNPVPFTPVDPAIAGISETEQIVQYVLERLSNTQPRTKEAQILAKGVDRLPQEEREQALDVVKAMFKHYADYFDSKESNNDT